jgi:hypothetical protein
MEIKSKLLSMYISEENAPLLSYLSAGIVGRMKTEPGEPIPVKSGTATVGPLPSVKSGEGTNIPGAVIAPNPVKTFPSPGPKVPVTSVTQPVKYNPSTETVVAPKTKTFSPLVYLAGGGLLLYYLFSKK